MKYSVDCVKVTVVEDEEIVSGSVNIYTAEFTFDESWDKYDRKIAVFKRGDIVKEQLLKDGSCLIPWEVLAHDLKCGLHVGVYAVTEAVVRPTLWSACKTIRRGATSGSAALEPTPTAIQQLLKEISTFKATLA